LRLRDAVLPPPVHLIAVVKRGGGNVEGARSVDRMATADDAPAVGSANIPATSVATSLFFMVPQYRLPSFRESPLRAENESTRCIEQLRDAIYATG
jgi:hypothetical protein